MAAPGTWDDWIGRSETRHDVLTQGLIDRLRATIDSGESGPVAPQGIHWCLCLPDAPTAMLSEDGHPVKGGFLPPIDLPRRMWASSSIDFLAPLAAGAAIERRSTIAAIECKAGASGPLVFVTVAHATFADGAEAVRERQTIVYREAASAVPGTQAGPAQTPPGRVIMPPSPLLLRYSALTFNAHRIHYDRPYATEIEGYRGLVVHGPLMATLLLDEAARALGANRLTHFAFRGVGPAFADEPLGLTCAREADTLTLTAHGPHGPVMKAEARVAL